MNRYAAYCFFLTTVYMNILWQVDPVKMLHAGWQWGAVLIYLVLMVLAVRHRAKELNQPSADLDQNAERVLTFMGVLKIAIVVGIAGTLGFHITQFMYAKLQPEVFEAAQLENIKRVIGYVQQLTGDDPSKVDYDELKDNPMFSYSFLNFLMGIGQGILGNFMLAAIVAAVMKRG